MLYEVITDPVRFIGNHSSGKMGFAIADEFAQRGANVTLIAGPVKIKSNNTKIKRIDVVSAQEMYEQASYYFEQTDITVLAAAVADYTPIYKSDIKLKKKDSELSIA